MRTSPQTMPSATARDRNHLRVVPDDDASRSHNVAEPYWTAIVIRPAVAADGTGLQRLADLDSARRLLGDTVVAEQAGSLVAAVSLRDGSAIADPFRATADIVGLLRLRARQLRRAERRSSTYR